MDREETTGAKSMKIEPTDINSVEELLRYQKDFDTGFHFTDKEAEMLLGYLEGHGYVIGHVEGELYGGDLMDVPNEVEWEAHPMDDVIDLVCEWNYEMILDMEAEIRNEENPQDFGEKQEKYDSLKADERVLDSLFEQTKYNAEINCLAEKLADEFIGQLNQQKDVDKAVENLVSAIKPPERKGKSR